MLIKMFIKFKQFGNTFSINMFESVDWIINIYSEIHNK